MYQTTLPLQRTTHSTASHLCLYSSPATPTTPSPSCASRLARYPAPHCPTRYCLSRLRTYARCRPPSATAIMVGEDSWIDYLDEAARDADLEQSVHVIELYKRAIDAEPGSLRLWLAYCTYFWQLWEACQASEPSGAWSEDEQLMGREIFSFGAALDLWQQGYEAIKFRINDSHLLWDRWLSLELEQLAKTKTPEGIRRITHLYRDRLLIPHVTWDHTSQAFSTFLSQHNTPAWEETMKQVTASAQGVKRAIAARDAFELKLSQASRSQDAEAQKSTMKEYLEWEMQQSKKPKDLADMAVPLCCGLFSRALTGLFALDHHVWLEYIVYVASVPSDSQQPKKLLDVLRRAVEHCPWSGQLWNRYILCAEEAKLAFSEIESIKHSATSDNQLYKNGMESMIEMYVAWCGFLKRTALEATAADEAVDVADVGLRAALEDVAVVGKRLYGKEFKGDPKFRLERIYIQYLTEKKGAVDEARAMWNKLADIKMHADSYEFWFRFYMWEMLIFSANPPSNRSPTPSSTGLGMRIPTAATAVLHAATTRETMDWPERILEVYLQHCNDYEQPATVRRATDTAHRVGQAVQKRRQREEEEKAAAYAAYYSAARQSDDETSKRKRESPADVAESESVSKRQRSREEAGEASRLQQSLKRDRENTSVLVTGLPGQVSETKVRQYFKDYGHINNLTAFVHDKDGAATTALIEFGTPQEAQSALLRDNKFFGQSQISVQPGHDLTVYLANYPPTADDKYMRRLFKDCGELLSVRWPSLKVNSHRRFCYVSFGQRGAAAKAVAKDGTLLDGKYRLLAKYSDPQHRKKRQGAVAEGREVHVTGLGRAVTEAEVGQVFAKYGSVKRVNMPLTLAGKSKGFAYVDFETSAQAEQAAKELNGVKLASEIIQVEVSRETRVKPSATSSASATPMDIDGPSPEQLAQRTIALLGLPDTVKDARIRALVDPLGPVVKLVVQPAHGGARIEFADAAAAGTAALRLDGTDFDGHRLRIGSLDDLRRARAAQPQNRIVYGAKTPSASSRLAPTSLTVRRPVPPKTTLRRPATTAAAAATTTPTTTAAATTATPPASERPKLPHDKAHVPQTKTNQDFRNLFLASAHQNAKSPTSTLESSQEAEAKEDHADTPRDS
ncbi:hypothetical protein CDD82_6353 [Ophiocordyceps australis]|uniref:RRM domain-containing protein n=1 Tax=Ophiocordyceps australis TaxID=1399860 RepID=A0A2C5YVF4_9HYPO|nr:hypothetical protein CDD82_6353 [Ophiocordyceps australis]